MGGHPMGEGKRRELAVRQQVVEVLGLQSASGPLKVRWDDKSQASVLGQMAFFIEFLTATGLFGQWVADCPLDYKSPNGSTRRDILGTWMLSILSGHWRYAHVSAIRADGVNPGLLGMSAVVAEDTLRRGLKAMDENAGDPMALASHRAHGVRLIRSAVDLRCGCHDQAFDRQTTGSGGGIQSAQAWKTIACLPQLSSLGAPTDAGSGCASGQ